MIKVLMVLLIFTFIFFNDLNPVMKESKNKRDFKVLCIFSGVTMMITLMYTLNEDLPSPMQLLTSFFKDVLKLSY